MDPLLLEFQRHLENRTTDGLPGSIDILVSQLENDTAHCFRLCAIPHQFNLNIIEALAPELTPSSIKEIYDEFANLSIVLSFANGELAFHDAARQYLFGQWLQPEYRSEFREANQQLFDYYERHSFQVRGVELELLRRSKMFHLIGFDEARGFDEFKSLFQEMRHQFRMSECKTLINLVREYEPILSTENKLWIIYYEATIAFELREFDRSEQALENININEYLPHILKIKTVNRLAIIKVRKEEYEQAIKYFQGALDLSEYLDLKDEIMNLNHDMGLMYVEMGKLDEAEDLINKSLELAVILSDWSGVARANNSLGLLHLRSGNPTKAIEKFEVSRDYLERKSDEFRKAQIYNNMGMAYADMLEWNKSKEVLQLSLEIKIKAGDLRGQANTWNNLVRVYQNLKSNSEAILASTKAIDLFRQVHDLQNEALATLALARHYLKNKDLKNARSSFLQVIALYKSANNTQKEKETSKELLAMQKKIGLPWWMWVAIAFGILFFALIAFFIFLAMSV